jgi:hypothetical protein
MKIVSARITNWKNRLPKSEESLASPNPEIETKTKGDA